MMGLIKKPKQKDQNGRDAQHKAASSGKSRAKIVGPAPQSAPQIAQILGYGGLLPFIGLGFLSLLPLDMLGPALQQNMLEGLLIYAAIILSFLGGLQWGRLAARARARFEAGFYIWSVVPSLWGWACLWLIDKPEMILLSLIPGFVISYLVDWQLVRKGRWPHWMAGLRLQLTLVACLMMAATSLVLIFA